MIMTNEQRATLRHMLGLNRSKTKTAYRNYYASPRDDAHLSSMEAAGLVYWVECSWLGEGGVWYAYRQAAEAVLKRGESLGDERYRDAPQTQEPTP